ncbi:MAG: Xaa-Pro peptidase family protein [Anaerolineaceae bacterium]|nr:Xaa-Pro peptidase family protein [Anaerolineaceae bacterium]
MAVVPASIAIAEDEYRARCAHLQEHCRDQGYDGIVIFDHQYILYYAGFAFIPTERPIAFAMNVRGERALFVPRLEVEHAQSLALIDRVDHYLEYPDRRHPMALFAQTLQEMGIQGRIGADRDGYPWVMGYRGPPLSELMAAEVVSIVATIEDQMMVKSPAEVALIAESCKWGNLAHMLLQRYTRPGITETEVSQRASDEATRAMLDAIGPIYRSQSWYGNASAGYRGQIGRNAAIPHALANNIVFQEGDVLVTGAGAAVWGYTSELERTMFIGPPTAGQRRFFDHMVALQDLALATIEPGRPCADVDRAVRAYYEEHDLWSHWKHHVGHAIGMRYHEGPFLDHGDATIIQPGMLFTVEPGLYSAELGGYRHSDTVLVTEDGIEFLTYYPRDIESLTIPV